MDLYHTLTQHQKKIEALLDRFFDTVTLEGREIDPCAEELFCLLRDYCKGGKYLRSALFCYGYHLFQKGQEQDVLNASLSVELLHNFLLIHDDIIDQDDIRRGKPTLHKMYEHLHKHQYPPPHSVRSLTLSQTQIKKGRTRESYGK